MTQVAVLTSYSMAPLNVKLNEIARHGISVIDLYCFCPWDMPVLCSQYIEKPWPAVILQNLDPVLVAQHIRHMIDRLEQKHGRKIDICAFASFLPDISLPDTIIDGEHLRTMTVKALGRLLDLLCELRARGFSCKVFEIVAGHTVILRDHGRSRTSPKLQYVHPDKCFEALKKSLDMISEMVDHRFAAPTSNLSAAPVFAFEVEPGVSKLISSPSSVDRLVDLIRQYPNTGLNLDVGHMLILGISPDDVFETDMGDWIAHAHISDNADAHYADLCVGSYHHEGVFAEWLQALDRSRHRGGRFQGYVSIEMEACGSIDKVREAYDRTDRMLRKTTRRYVHIRN